MTQELSLEELVLGYCVQVGGLVEPPAYGITETLLPDEIAGRWGIAPLQRFAFAPAYQQEGVTFLHYGHPLVETIANEIRQRSANGQFFINNTRPEKPGLYAAAEKALSLPNAKMFAVPDETGQTHTHHYVRFNFKASLIADERRELILPLWMDLESGFPVDGAEIERLALLDEENASSAASPAAVSWNHEPPLAAQTLSALLERARKSVAREMGDTLAHLEKRLARFLDLDRARLEEYYADLLKDAERRRQKAEEDRRPALEGKIAAIAAERAAKLADVEQKYHLRVQLELLNLAMIALPKLDLTVEIRKRTVAVKRTVSWNPLLHRIEPLACDVCDQAGTTLLLCENGHLAHAECLAPQCVDCKRTFCQKCAQEVQACVVCDRPVCVHSLVHCPTCGRATCQEHPNLCHAENGQPRKIGMGPEKPLIAEAEERTQTPAPANKPGPTKEPAPKQKPAAKREAAKGRTSSQKFVPPRPLADYIEVYADPTQGTITAYAMVKKREFATRWWTMGANGIAVSCKCEKERACREDGLVYWPWDDVEGQMKSFLSKFRVEYNVPENKVRYFQIRQDRPFDEKKLRVPSSWKDPLVIEQAREGFEKLRQR